VIQPRLFWRALLLVLACASLQAEVKRLVIVKLDGIPHDVLERELQRVDPTTGKSTLPWIERIFVQRGTRVENFYVRAISLSAPSWSLLDTGQHLQIRGNAEFDRYTYHVYDYLNFFPFYVGYALSHRVDMPGVEVLDDLGIPLLSDRFPYEGAYQSFQLYQRGVRWKTLQHSLQSRFSRSVRELLDEWTIGFEIGSSIEAQTERELIDALADPHIQYLDYFTGDYDHIAHSTPDAASQRLALQRIDALIGRIWTAIEGTPEAGRTAVVVVSDHGMNTRPGTYSQGFDLVSYFNSRPGGGHHVVTDRHPLTDYKLKGLDPFVSEVVTPSADSLYLTGAANQYPTVLLDLDGNERAAVYLRNSDLNSLHILLQRMNRAGLEPAARRELAAAFLAIVDRHREEWQSTVSGLRAELAALHRVIESQRAKIAVQPKKWTVQQRDAGLDKAARRLSVQVDSWRDEEESYTEYVKGLTKLLALSSMSLENRRFNAEELIPKHAMGDANTIHDLQNYVIGPGTEGGFQTVNYFRLLTGLSVKNNVQANVGSHPVDFSAVRLPDESVWLYGDETHQAIVSSRQDAQGNLKLRYQPVRGLRQDSGGAVSFEPSEFGPGFPLRLWEDPELATPGADRDEWLSAWHSERDWLRAVHKTRYSNGIIALQEQFRQDSIADSSEGDAVLLRRFKLRKRRLAQPDFLIFANDHWNFNVRGFNPGGNHGSFLRISSHSVLMLAGGEQTGIPKNFVIEEPYDSLSFVPTLLSLMGLPDASHLPGKPIQELLPQTEKPVTTSPEATARTR